MHQLAQLQIMSGLNNTIHSRAVLIENIPKTFLSLEQIAMLVSEEQLIKLMRKFSASQLEVMACRIKLNLEDVFALSSLLTT